jgi:steroid 5-alpha reductase family enzyme
MSAYIFSLCAIITLTTFFFIVAVFKKDNSIIDRLYGITFVVVAWLMTFIQSQVTPPSSLSVLMLILISMWGLRLSSRIHIKNKKKGEEDFRYKKWREIWLHRGTRYFYLRSYLQFFVVQGIVASVVLIPFTLVLTTKASLSSPFITLGLIVWLFGFLFETIADYQVDTFVQKKHHDGDQIMKQGLWKYSRHPNYFGESLMWWGLACMAVSQASIIVFISPLLITFLLLKVSGIPLLEQKWSGLPEWEAYKKKTSAFVPFPPKQ